MDDYPAEVTKNYTIIENLGSGAFGVVCKVKKIGASSEDEFYAMKEILQPRSKKNIENEIRVLSEFENPYLIHLKDLIKADGRIFLITDICETDLRKKVAKNNLTKNILTKNEIRKYFIEICLGLECLHTNDFIHQDIKLDNILLDKNNKIKIADFGLARHENAATSEGTDRYKSPSMKKGEVASKKSDIWALGCVLYALCEGKYPFKSSKKKLYKPYKPYKPISVPGISKDLIYFVSWCLNEKRDERPAIKDILSHPKIIEKLFFLNIEVPKGSLLAQISRKSNSDIPKLQYFNNLSLKDNRPKKVNQKRLSKDRKVRENSSSLHIGISQDIMDFPGLF